MGLLVFSLPEKDFPPSLTTATSQYDGDGVIITSANGVPNKPSASPRAVGKVLGFFEDLKIFDGLPYEEAAEYPELWGRFATWAYRKEAVVVGFDDDGKATSAKVFPAERQSYSDWYWRWWRLKNWIDALF
jgi:hypothetical protein